MIQPLATYLPRESPVHRVDPRVKIVLLIAYSAALFLTDTWWGMLLCALAFVLLYAASRLPVGRMLKALAPLYLILLFTWAFNALSFDGQATGYSYGTSAAAAGVFAGADPIPLVGSLVLLPAGCATGCFIMLRILLLTMASFMVVYSTASTALVQGAASLMSPLRRLHVPVDDVAMVLSLALRFIPLTAEEVGNVRMAQQARGAHFEDGGFWIKLKAWGAVFVPLFVNLFRRAERIGNAFDARCYGAVSPRTVLYPLHMNASGWIALVGGLIFCIAAAVLL